ncbi:MAG: carboxypeptidase regulatory-like domain-containing protein [Myxococcales bacterium]|nr:carboxypeptidase regulatory-like domain-containing protein [Myxococcales bacterium]
MRTILLSSLSLGPLLACSETGIKHVTDYGGVYESSINGRVCDPERNAWMEGATVYTHIVSDDGELIGTVEAITDTEGYFTLEGLRDGLIYTVYVQFGSTVIDQYDVDLTEGGEVNVPEPACGGSVSGDVAVVTGDFDDMGAVLQAVGITSFTVIDGRDASGLVEFLSSADNLTPFATVYFAGGHIEEDVLYDTDGSDTAGDVARTVAAVRLYAMAGGKVVASDWSYDVIEQIWPGQVEFLGDDTVPNDAELGVPMNVNATILDSGLASAVGEASMTVNFDLDAWPVIESVGDEVTTLQQGDVTWRFGLDTTNERAKPLAVTFAAGDGLVVYTSWRMASNSEGKGGKVIRYLINDL